jgi:hypothetical protein
MSLNDEIRAAIAAHGMWKTRLRSAIATAKSEFSPSQLRVDNGCGFGKWIHGITDAKITASPAYQKCLSLHRAFHVAAAEVLSLALAGKKGEAEKAMGVGANYSAVSASLTRAMMEWGQGQ